MIICICARDLSRQGAAQSTACMKDACCDARCWRVRPESAYHATGWGCGLACAASWPFVTHTSSPSSAWRRPSAKRTRTSARNAGELSLPYLLYLLMWHMWTLQRMDSHAEYKALQHFVRVSFKCTAELSAGAYARVVFPLYLSSTKTVSLFGLQI